MPADGSSAIASRTWRASGSAYRPARHRCPARRSSGRDSPDEGVEDLVAASGAGRPPRAATSAVEVGPVGNLAEPVDLLAVPANPVGPGRPRARVVPGRPACPRRDCHPRPARTSRGAARRGSAGPYPVAGRGNGRRPGARASRPGQRPPRRSAATIGREPSRQASTTASMTSGRRRGWSPRTTRAADTSGLDSPAAASRPTWSDEASPSSGFGFLTRARRASGSRARSRRRHRPTPPRPAGSGAGERIEDVLQQRPPLQPCQRLRRPEPGCRTGREDDRRDGRRTGPPDLRRRPQPAARDAARQLRIASSERSTSTSRVHQLITEIRMTCWLRHWPPPNHAVPSAWRRAMTSRVRASESSKRTRT